MLCFQAALCGTLPNLSLRSSNSYFVCAAERNVGTSGASRRRRAPACVMTTTSSTATNSANDTPLSETHSNVPTTTSRNWMFFDVARVLVRGGTGGKGCVAFLREKGNARGGPSGGTGGRGGHVIFIARRGPNTLQAFRGSVAYRAPHGTNGSGKGRTGEGASDTIVEVPLGTIVRAEDGTALADLSTPGAKLVAAKGGRGGRGNAAFKTAQHTAPRCAEPGEPGVERWLRLELKLVADVALVGAPNAGKSTLLRSVSNASPKVADYPFTTVVPNLGVVDGDTGTGLVLADVPGLVEGAHRGVGMGVAFLRHVERCRIVLHIIDGTADDEEVLQRYGAIRREMEMFNDALGRKKEVVLVNKADVPGVRERWQGALRDRLVAEIGSHKRVALVSAMRNEGLRDVLRRVEALVAKEDAVETPVMVLGDEEERLRGVDVCVERDYAGRLVVSGWKVERAYRMTNWDLMESIDRFQRILGAIGVNEKLRKIGARNGHMVRCVDREFVYSANDNVYSAAAMEDGYAD